jgi:maleate cis-trans isomerase
LIPNISKPGCRGKVGLILPSSNTITEPIFYSLSPQGLSFHTSRTFITGTAIKDIAEMEKEKEIISKKKEQKAKAISYYQDNEKK